MTNAMQHFQSLIQSHFKVYSHETGTIRIFFLKFILKAFNFQNVTYAAYANQPFYTSIWKACVLLFIFFYSSSRIERKVCLYIFSALRSGTLKREKGKENIIIIILSSETERIGRVNGESE